MVVDGKHTVGVWVGRPDGAPVPGLVGREAAATLFDAFARMGALVTSSAKLPPPLRRFQAAPGASANAQASLHILFPPDGDQA